MNQLPQKYFIHNHPTSGDSIFRLWADEDHPIDSTFCHEIPRKQFVDLYLDEHFGRKGEEILCDYQIRMMDHVVDIPKCALFADMGLGKTVAVWMALLELFRIFEVGKVLIVAPLRVARKVWTDELDDWDQLRDKFTVSKIIGKTAKQRMKGVKADAQIYLINRENFVWLVDQYKPKSATHLLQPWPWEMLVIDESTSFKTKSSERWKAWERIRYQIDRTVLLTGTPAPHSLMDLYSQIYMLDHGERLGKDPTAFQNRWFDWVLPRPNSKRGKWQAKPNAEREIYSRISDICVSLKAEDYLDMPLVTYNSVRIDLTTSQGKKYRKMQRDYVIELGGQIVSAVNAGVLAGKLLQLCNGAAYTTHPDWVTLHNAKLNALAEVIEQTDGHMLIMYSFKSDITRISEMFTKKRLNWRKLDTEQDEDDWNAGKIDYLLLHPASAGHGCNLQHGGETICWFGLPWSLEHWLQANARIIGGHRAVDKHPVIHFIIYDQGYDRVVRDTLLDREATQKGCMDALSIYIKDIVA